MKRLRSQLIAGSLLLVAGLSLWHLASPEEPAAAQAATAPSDPSAASITPRSGPGAEYLALRAELARLRGQVAGIRSELDDPSASPGERLADDEAPEIIDRYGDLAPAERDAAIAEDLDAVMAAEPVDGDWGAETEALVTSAVAGLGSAALVSVSCRQTMCRAELSHGGVAERDRELGELVHAAPFNTEGFVHMRLSDPPESAIYFTREGHQLPRQ